MSIHDPRVRRRYFQLKAECLNWLSIARVPTHGDSLYGHVARVVKLAQVLEDWDDLEDEGVVRMRCEPDGDFADTEDFDPRPPKSAHEEKIRAWQRRMSKLDSMGCWWYCAEYVDPRTGRWEQADSIGGCWGELDDADYGGDLKHSAIDALYAARAEMLAEAVADLESRATYAAGSAA